MTVTEWSKLRAQQSEAGRVIMEKRMKITIMLIRVAAHESPNAHDVSPKEMDIIFSSNP